MVMEGSNKKSDWCAPVREQPAVYIGRLGSGYGDGVLALLDSILDIHVFEFRMGFGKEISLEASGSAVSIRDYGRGFPLDSLVSVTSGVGVGMCNNALSFPVIGPLKVANALSADFRITSYRDGECSMARYSKGELLDKGFGKTSRKNGSLIEFTLDEEALPGAHFNPEAVRGLLSDIKGRNTGLCIIFNGENI